MSSAPPALLDRLPDGLRTPLTRLLGTWPGRIVLHSFSGMVRVEIVDRAMTLAAQFFTSVFPIMIMLAVWLGPTRSDEVAEAVELPEQTQQLLDDLLRNRGVSTFGVLGSIFVLVSATSLSRALTRALTAVWELPRIRLPLLSAWRLLAAVIAVALSLLLSRFVVRATEPIPPHEVWSSVAVFCVYALTAIAIPWLLLAGRVATRSLVPGALTFAVIMVFVRPASHVVLPRSLEVSAERYGSIGVAFTYLTWLYVISLVLLGSAVIGRAIATDEGAVGRYFSRR